MGLKGPSSTEQGSIIKPLIPPNLPISAGVQGLSALPGVPQYAPQAPAQTPMVNSGPSQGPSGMQGLLQLLSQFQGR